MNKRNWLVLLLIGAFAITTFNSCKKEESTDTDTGPTEWETSIVLTGKPRNGAATFTINDVAYLVGGQMKNNELLSDSYSFDGTSWTKKAEFTGPKRHSGVGFAVAGKGYVGLGFGNDGVTSGPLKDFYQYDPATNAWKKIADFPGDARHSAVAFTLGNAAYVGLGGNNATDETFSDFYKYDPATDKWTEIATSFSNKKMGAYAFVINNVAYVGGGISNGVPTNDFYSFDGTKWEKRKSLTEDNKDARRVNASAFTIGNNGYVVSGRSQTGVVSTVWKYNPAENAWSDGSESIPSAREKSVAFAIKGKGYISTGNSGTGSFFDDTYVFTPVR
ncbi:MULTISPECIES: Kelch repeat-containing protein [Sphingobacterium]|uniref:Kelch repeat-containing protein n=1 Tax=Sphingobacterium TaxID=28453 RepID=UPI001624E74F|nr:MULTISPECIES: kelch repeat-containing protein [Sphingobacterium]